MGNHSISPATFIKSIKSQLSAGTGDIVCIPSAASILFPYGSSVRPIIKREDAELICHLETACNFHANAFGYLLPGHHFIIERQFWEFCFYLESQDYVYDPNTIPKEYTNGTELLHEAFHRLNETFAKGEFDTEQRKNLTMILTNLISKQLVSSLYEPVIPDELLWRPYDKYGVDVLVGFYYISRKEVADGKWVYTNMLTHNQCEGPELTRYGLALLIAKDTSERISYNSIDTGDIFWTYHGPIIGSFNPWKTE